MDIKTPASSKPSQKQEAVEKPGAATLVKLDLPPVNNSQKLTSGPKKSKTWLWWLIGIATFLILVGAAIAGSLWWYNDSLQPRSASNKTVDVLIEPGASVDQIAQELEQKQIIKSALAMSLYMKFNSKGQIKTGTYFFAPNQTVAEIVSWINDGNVGIRKVTILPGQTIKEIRQVLIDDGFGADAVDAALNKTYNLPLFSDKPANATLEGYIYPETYYVDPSMTPEDLLTMAFNEFEKQLDADNMRAQLAARGFNLYQGITLASIVANETSNVQDQKQVAQVFEKRLAENMPLGSDVTYHYAADLLGVEPAVDLDSPYNTRIYKGLPPGPISNFNYPALQAVAQPAAGDYLYFVAGDDGVTYFSRTQEEHEQNIKDHCKVLCQSA